MIGLASLSPGCSVQVDGKALLGALHVAILPLSAVALAGRFVSHSDRHSLMSAAGFVPAPGAGGMAPSYAATKARNRDTVTGNASKSGTVILDHDS